MDKLNRYWATLVLVVLCGMIFSSRLYTYREPLERDVTTYAVIAHEMLAGKALYRELWDHKAPAIHVTYAAAELVAGYGRNSIFLMNVSAALATLFICYWAGTLAGGGRVGGCFAAAFWAVSCGNLALEANQPNTEVFMNVFLAGGFALFARAGTKNLGTCVAFAAGMLFAIASLYKPVVIVQPALLAFAFISSSGRQFRKRACVDVLVIAATGIVMWAVVFGYFFARGSGAAFAEAVFGYNRYYSSNLAHQALNNFKGWMASSPEVLLVLLCGAILAVIGIVLGLMSGQKRRWVLLLAYLISSEIAVLLPGWPFPHYYQLLLPAIAIGAGWSIEHLKHAVRPRFSSLPYAAGGVACAAIALIQLPNYFLSPDDWSLKKYGSVFVETEQLADKIDDLLPRGETFYEWGSETGLYFAHGRRPASGITFAFPMLGGPLKEELSVRLIEDLKRAQPELIVADVPTMTLTEREHPVLVWFRENYKAFARTDNFLLFARNGSNLERRMAAPGQTGHFPLVGKSRAQ